MFFFISRFYNKSEVEANECRYVKIKCEGHGGAPAKEQVEIFKRICQNFIRQHPLEIIAVHCTHGFNRTGFMIASFLIETEDWSPEAAWLKFRDHREPGIYKQEYIHELFSRYGDVDDAPSAPERPEWRDEEESEHLDDEGGNNRQNGHNGPNNFRKGKVPVFMEGVPGVHPVTDPTLLKTVQRRISQLCGHRGRGFPGAQPVSMDRDNLLFLQQNPYKVSWKADGTRYMMLIDGPDGIFFADRDYAIFKVEGMTFLERKTGQPMKGTLLDGEMVLDEDPREGRLVPRYLVYDILTIFVKGQDIKVMDNADFNNRLVCIEREIVGARNQFIVEGKIDKAREPFRIRLKQFWDIRSTSTLLGPKFTKKELGHEPDGLIFQPLHHRYICGRDYEILKWKPSSHNSIDFKLKIERENRPGMLAKDIGKLYVGGLDAPYDEIKLNKVLRALNYKIIECKWDFEKKGWSFMRERTDKSFPNAFNTAQGVMKSITDPVTEADLLHVASSIPSTSQGQKRRADMPPPSAPPPRKSSMMA